MGKLLRFFSLTTASQLVLLVNQLVLLPIQLRTWGSETTADWLVVLALANIASVADLGLRNAGHADLLASARKADGAAADRFRQLWALVRLLFVLTTAALLCAQLVRDVWTGAPVRAWVLGVTVAFALETFVIVRGMWLDTLGEFVRVESVYLGLVGLRVLLSLAALLIFQASPAALGWIMLATAAGAVLLQAVVLRPGLLRLAAGGFRDVRWRALLIVRLVVAEPVANWVRLSLPVIVLAAIASPVTVTVYVALRAVFGLVRQVVSQLARYASVRYVEQVQGDSVAANRALLRAVLFSVCAGVAISTAVLADDGRLIGRWLGAAVVDDMIAATFAATAVGYGYQVALSLMTRTGDVAGVARRQYAYLAAAAAAAVVGLTCRSTHLYLGLIIAQELAIAGLFYSAFNDRVRRAVFGALLAGLLLNLLLWFGSRWLRPALSGLVAEFSGVTALTVLATLGMASVCILLDRAFVRKPPDQKCS